MTGLLKLPCLRLVILLQPGDAEKGGNVAEEWRGEENGSRSEEPAETSHGP